MLTKTFAALLSFVILVFGSQGTVSTVHNTVDYPSENTIYFTDFSQLSTESIPIDTIVITDEQMLALGPATKDLFAYSQKVYILTDKSVSDIQKICEIPAHIHSTTHSQNKYATIIEYINSEYTFNNIFAIECGTQTSEKKNGSNLIAQKNIAVSQLVEDGLNAYRNTKAAQTGNATRMQPSNFYTHATDSGVLYNSADGSTIGTMGYTVYWYKVTKSGTTRIFDAVCVASFAPVSNLSCKKMSVYLGTSYNNHVVLEAANIISTGQTYTHNLSLSAGTSGVNGNAGTSWSYTANAQTVTKSFDMTTNDRTWIFEPTNATAGDAWIEEPGIRMRSTQSRCHTTVRIACPLLAIVAWVTIPSNDMLSTNWFFDWN